VARAKQRTLSQIADDILGIRGKEEILKNQLKELEEKRRVFEQELIAAAEKQGQVKGGGKTSTWTVTADTVPQVTDWDAFHEFIADKKWFHLLQRRPAVKACQELWTQGMVIPGTEKYTTMKVNVKGV
jgi:hypothetical protein